MNPGRLYISFCGVKKLVNTGTRSKYFLFWGAQTSTEQNYSQSAWSLTLHVLTGSRASE